MTGFAVVDVETTGLYPGKHDRIVEIAVVQLAPDGTREGSWSTLVNAERDLGPQHVHGISAADLRHAPRFRDIAGYVASLLEGRVFVAHNASFDARFVVAAYSALGYDVPIVPSTTLCTMRLASEFLPEAPRTLTGCCGCAGIALTDAHAALADAEATAELLRHYLRVGATAQPSSRATLRARLLGHDGSTAPWASALELCETTPWPAMTVDPVEAVVRGVAADRDVPFLERLVGVLPAAPVNEAHADYLALLDRALLDRYLSAREHDALASVAVELGVTREQALALHRRYLAELAAAAWADGVVTDDERADLDAVALLLGLCADDVERALAVARGEAPSQVGDESRFHLEHGDLVVFTGDMALSRDEWFERTRRAGLVPHTGITKRVALLVAADPDSPSGKARKAVDYGIPIVGEEAFGRMLAAM